MGQSTTELDAVRTLTIEGHPIEAKRARTFARECLKGLGCSPDTIDDGELIVSELATNSIIAAPGKKIEISIFPIKDLVAIYVYDPVDDLPQPKRLSLIGEKGRGIPIVKKCARRYGIFRSLSGGKVVWVMVRRFS
ncbi:ATP-binding protein [Actinoallomurus sp. NPDC050550]|uniref:ATP-binding protein n=1 Tax=Actinoallomurus sp. NPDC050550 TaxID=3154937 RepID=UPI0033E73F09